MPRIAFFEVSADEQPLLQERLPQHPQWTATYAPEPLTAATALPGGYTQQMIRGALEIATMGHHPAAAT